MSYGHEAPGYPQVGFNPQVGNYPPPAGGYPLQAVGYPPQTEGYPPPQSGYPPPQSGHPAPGAPYQPVVVQPTSGSLAGPGAGACPPGLEYLAQLDQVLIKQQVELLEAFTGFESANKYKILNNQGQEMLYAVEDTDCCTRQCCGPTRPFDMKIMNAQQGEVIHLERPLRCQSCFFPCCLQRLEVTSGQQLLGVIKQNWSLCSPSFDVEDASGHVAIKISGPCLTLSCCGDVEFELFDRNGGGVGKICKQWTGLTKEAFTDSDNFGITFPRELDVKLKATLLGAVFLIDFMFFEKSSN